MKKVLQLTLALFLTLQCSWSQEKFEFVDIDEIGNQAGIASDKGDYQKTLELLNKVSKNDSSYCSILISKSYYLLNTEQYDKAIETANEGLNLGCYDNRLSLYINKGVGYVNKDNYEEGLKTYNEALKTYPYYYKLWYNKGIALEKLERPEEAAEAYKKAIIYDPSEKSAHLKLGNLCYKQGLMAQALMCFNMYLLLEPDGEGAFDILRSLNELVASKNDNEPDPDLEISADDEAFEEIDLILTNKIALNKKYKIDNKIDISLVRQNHALLEQLKDFEGNDGFWDKKYVPFFKWIQQSGQFDNFIYTLVYSIENEKFKKIVDKNLKEIKSFIGDMVGKWYEVNQMYPAEFKGKVQDVYHHYSEGRLQALGKMMGDNMVGDWEFFNSLGQLKSTGSFKSGSRDGDWTWFTTKGDISETIKYVNGKLNGPNIVYFENGKVKIEANYKDEQLDGEYKYYNEDGAMLQKKYFKAGELDGTYLAYFKVGDAIQPEYKFTYENGDVKGEGFEYYADGSVYAHMVFENGDRHGVQKTYAYNQNVVEEITYANGKLHGPYTLYYENGNKKEEGNSVEGWFNGPWKIYYEDGTLQADLTYDSGKVQGVAKYYDRDGKPHYEYEYRRGEIIAYKFYDKSGKVIKEGRKKGGEFSYKGFWPNGNPMSEGVYDIKGGKKGPWKFYNSNGQVDNEGNYRENMAQGEHKVYYKNGNLQILSHYENDSINGYYVDYYMNGQIEDHGYYKGSQPQGEWRYYYKDGTLKSVYFFHKGELNGEQKILQCRR